AGGRASQPESLSMPVPRMSSRVMWPVDRPTAPCRVRQPPLPATTVAFAIGAASDITSRAAHTDAAVRTVPRIELPPRPGSGVPARSKECTGTAGAGCIRRKADDALERPDSIQPMAGATVDGDVLRGEPPAFDRADAADLADRLFGLRGTASPVGSERDQGFVIRSPDGAIGVLKISNASEERAVVDMETAAALHVLAVDPSLPVAAPL